MISATLKNERQYLYHESEYKQVFNDADSNGDGYIDYTDLRQLILQMDDTFPEHVIKKAFLDAKIRIPPKDKMDLPEFLEAMSRLMAYRGHRLNVKGPILYSRFSSTMSRWLKTARFERWVYEQFFYETDQDKDGFITYEEFMKTAVRYDMEYLARTIRLEFRKHNTRGDGYMDLIEFMIAMGFPPLHDIIRPKTPPPVVESKKPKKKPKGSKFELGDSLLRSVFMSMDQDGDGVLNRDELFKVFIQMGQEKTLEEIDSMIKANDKQGDGSLNYDEFVNSVFPTVREVDASDDEEEE